jgi:hypothetical protein
MKIREYFDRPSRWIKGREKQYDENNREYKYCLLGAIEQFYENSSDITKKVRETILCASITEWNDAQRRTFDEIVDLVNKLDI